MNEGGERWKEGGLGGAFAIGRRLGCRRSEPCGAPVMAAVLTWVGRRQRHARFLYLFVFSLGMTALLIVVGTFSGALARLPKAGVWNGVGKRLLRCS